MLWDEVNTSYGSELCGKDPEDLIIEVGAFLFLKLVLITGDVEANYEFPGASATC